MKHLLTTFALACLGLTALAQNSTSPNGKITIATADNGLKVCYQEQVVLNIPAIGFEGASTLSQLEFVRDVNDDYTMLAGKRLHATNAAKEYQASLGENTRIVVRLYNDGVAFRYELSGLNGCKAPKELTTFLIPEGTKRWMQNWCDSNEELFPIATTYKAAPNRRHYEKNADGYAIHWAYPALLEPAEGIFALISEANIERRQSASTIYNEGELYRVTPSENEVSLTGDWHTPWRVAIIGNLADVVASTLITDVSEPCQIEDTSWIQPGVVSWIYWAYNHGSNDYNIICKYVDMAATLHLPYVLIDAEWDEMMKGCSALVIRGEESMSRACLSGIPFIWHAYPQSDEYQLVKVRALLERMKPHFDEEDFEIVSKTWLKINGYNEVSLSGLTGQSAQDCDVQNMYIQFFSSIPRLVPGFRDFAQSLRKNGDLCANLMTFIEKLAII